jgi:ABC-type dipeptide/oligopeptide/nickel transport system permease component
VLNYIFGRLAQSLVVLLGAVTLIFVILRIAPGDPATVYAGPSATSEQIAAVAANLGVDRPFYEQYSSYLGDLLRFELGQSYRLAESSAAVVIERLPATALLATSAVSLALLLSVPLGIIAARHSGERVDHSISMGSLAGQAAPKFWVGIVAILVFARRLGWLPSSGYGDWEHLVLPAIVLSLPLLGVLIRLVRAGLIEVLNEPYILTARAKGLRGRTVVYRHALKNMMIPVLTVVALQAGGMLGGTVALEVVFGWPGIGRLLIDAITNRDYAVVQAVVIFVAMIFITLNLIVDILYGYLDPRARLESR